MHHLLSFILIILFLGVILLDCNAIDSSNNNDNSELISLLEKVSGIYADPNSKPKGFKKSLDKTVIVTACNHGFLNHLYNFDCFMKRLKFKYLVIAMDKTAYTYLKTNTSILTYYMPSAVEITTQPQEFRSRHFNIITSKKKEAVLNIMKLGYNVLFSDTDVAMVRDPLPYMIWDNVDYVHSLNAFCKVNEHWDFFYKSKLEGNTGFYYVRSNEKTMKLWADSIAAAPKFPRLDDQAVFWRVIRQSKDPAINPIQRCHDFTTNNPKPFLVTCMLDSCVFSSGMISNMYVPELTYGKNPFSPLPPPPLDLLQQFLFRVDTLMLHLKQLNESIVTLHANYISGNKKKMNKMKEHGFWLADISADGNSYTCQPFVQRLANITLNSVR